MVEAAIYSRLTAYTNLTNLVGDRIYQTVARQGASNPLVVINLITLQPTNAMGIDIAPTEAGIQVSVFAENGASCASVAEQVKAALQRYRGTSGGIVVQATFLDSERSDFEPENKEHRRDLDFRVYFEE